MTNMPARKKTSKKKTAKKTKKQVRVGGIWSPGFTREDAIEITATLLARRVNHEAIRRIVSMRLYGSVKGTGAPVRLVSERELDALKKDAQDRAMQAYHRDLDKSKAQAVSTYEEIIRDPISSPSERLQSQKRIDELMGHDYKLRSDRDESDEDRAIRIILSLQAARASVPDPSKTK